MRRLFIVIVASTSLCACGSSSPAAAPGEDAGKVADAGEPERPLLLPGCPLDPGPATVDFNLGSLTDPAGSPKKFTLDKALAGYPEVEGVLTALITTEKGTIRCELDEESAPITVANFVGLARGSRPFSADAGPWKLGRFYDGLLWHRVIPNFVIQGGDPLGNGTGNPGYVLPLENQVSEPLGTLAMAAAAEPNGSQFYIVVGKGPAANYNVFGKCETATAIAIAGEARDSKDKPVADVHMQRVDIARCAK